MDAGSNGITYTTYRGSKDGGLVQSSIHRDSLARDEVLLRVTHSALCATDEVYLETDMCLGHECAGVVQDVGPETRDLKVYVSSFTPQKKTSLSSEGELTAAVLLQGR